MPQLTRFQPVVQAEKIKKRPALLPDMAVPATDIRRRWLIDQKRWMTILTIVMMPAKRTTSHPVGIKGNISTDNRYGFLAQTPLPNGIGYPNRCGRLRFFEGYVLLGWSAPGIALKQDG